MGGSWCATRSKRLGARFGERPSSVPCLCLRGTFALWLRGGWRLAGCPWLAQRAGCTLAAFSGSPRARTIIAPRDARPTVAGDRVRNCLQYPAAVPSLGDSVYGQGEPAGPYAATSGASAPRRAPRKLCAQSSTMVASAVYILDLKGKILISRNYRGDIPKSAAERCVCTRATAPHAQSPLTPALPRRLSRTRPARAATQVLAEDPGDGRR